LFYLAGRLRGPLKNDATKRGKRKVKRDLAAFTIIVLRRKEVKRRVYNYPDHGTKEKTTASTKEQKRARGTKRRPCLLPNQHSRPSPREGKRVSVEMAVVSDESK